MSFPEVYEVDQCVKTGTGTAVGDPIETMAIGNVFGPSHSVYDPLYM